MNTKLAHIRLVNPPEITHYTSSTTGFSQDRPLIERERRRHGENLSRALASAEARVHEFYARHKITRKGCYLEFLGEEGFDFASKSLENLRATDFYDQIRIVTQKEEDDIKQVVVYVPLNKVKFYADKIESYVTKDTKSGNPSHNLLINNLKDIKEALFAETFWQDPVELLPGIERKWCEAWLSCSTSECIEKFEKLLIQKNIPYKKPNIVFLERAVKLVNATRNELSQIAQESDDLAEFRIAKVTASFWTGADNFEQNEWAHELLDRLEIDRGANTSICILDTGVNNNHILIRPLLANSDCLAVDPSWGSDDHAGHGTEMAGLSGYGDLQDALETIEPISKNHMLESIKILPPNSENSPELWGDITSQAVSISEITNPHRNRLFCMAVTSADSIDKGRPSSWSASIDQITSGSMDEDKPKRLFIISSGNIQDFAMGVSNYPTYQITQSVHDPAQSWNALTVGAYTKLSDIVDPSYNGYICVAPAGGISPFTTTSRMWDKKWPFKPDVMFEGGNIAHEQSSGFYDTDCNDLALLTTYFRPQESTFWHTNQTSAATALAANFAARLQANYPEFWPETIRGLIVHSADWSQTLVDNFALEGTKTSRYNLMRTCGYGIPNIEKALYSAENRLTLIAQEFIQPFEKWENRVRTNEMHLYELPWPKIVLQDLPSDIEIVMKVTLSYFIEPSPGEVGWKNKYKYPSHNLTFRLNSPAETKEQFTKRINKELLNEDDIHITSAPSDHWEIGQNNRHQGSIHKDIWRGTPQELANSNLLAIVPQTGWWKERHKLEKYNSKARYALIISIDSPTQNIDIYTPVKIQIENQVPVKIAIE